MAMKRVLLVDDDRDFARLTKQGLEATGQYEVRTENWAEDAVATARQFRPDVVLLDILMPRMPGGNVVVLFEKDPELKTVPLIFLTGAIRKEQVEEHEGIICGRPCVAKPATLEAIVEAIEKYTAAPPPAS